MNNSTRKFNTGLAIALTATIATVAQPQPASAQILDIAAGVLNTIVGNRQPQQPPQIIQQQVPVPINTGPEFNVGTNNANGNNLNLCVSNCLPPGASSSHTVGVSQPRPVVQQAPVVQQQGQGTVTSTTQVTQQSSVQTAN